MNWNAHSNLDGAHAFLSPSKYHWIRYDEEKLRSTYANYLATLRGTELHKFAADAIRMRRRQIRNNDTVNMYINDAIGYRLSPETPLFYSDNCFGTSDTIGFNEKQRLLRIHDLKTGVIPAHMEQLEVYAALFLLEYGARLNIARPQDIDMELRIYQNGDKVVENPDPVAIEEIMDTIVESDKIIDEMQQEE